MMRLLPLLFLTACDVSECVDRCADLYEVRHADCAAAWDACVDQPGADSDACDEHVLDCETRAGLRYDRCESTCNP